MKLSNSNSSSDKNWENSPKRSQPLFSTNLSQCQPGKGWPRHSTAEFTLSMRLGCHAVYPLNSLHSMTSAFLTVNTSHGKDCTNTVVEKGWRVKQLYNCSAARACNLFLFLGECLGWVGRVRRAQKCLTGSSRIQRDSEWFGW